MSQRAEPPVIDCEAIADDLLAMLDHELSGLRAEAVNAHFGACPHCAAFYQQMREQLVSHRLVAGVPFELDLEADVEPGDLPGYERLADRLRDADVAVVGRVLYEVLKAEFLHDYGEGLRAAAAPILDPDTQRLVGEDMVEDLRDWHDRDDVDGVDLGEVADRLHGGAATDRLATLIEGMEVVVQAAPSLQYAARYYQAMAHVKAARSPEATALFSEIVEAGPAPLNRMAQVCRATLPVLIGADPLAGIAALETCLVGHEDDAVVLYNLAKAHFMAQGALNDVSVAYLRRAEAAAPEMVLGQLSNPSERALARAVRTLQQRRA